MNYLVKIFSKKNFDFLRKILLHFCLKISGYKNFGNFFENVQVNDENHDIKNNRLELLKMFCNTFDKFINFSKLEGF